LDAAGSTDQADGFLRRASELEESAPDEQTGTGQAQGAFTANGATGPKEFSDLLSQSMDRVGVLDPRYVVDAKAHVSELTLETAAAN
jgi:hypothetical protein